MEYVSDTLLIVRVAYMRDTGKKEYQSVMVTLVMRSPRSGKEEERACQQKLEQLHAPESGA